MRQITVRQLVRQAKDIQSWLPFELVKDGEVIAVALPSDGKQAKSAMLQPVILAKHDVRQGTGDVIQADTNVANDVRQTSPMSPQRRRKQTDNPADGLRFSKSAQAAGRMR